MQLSPGESFPLTYKVTDPNNTDTVYVQAVIKSGTTVLDTVNLTSLGSGLFSANWIVAPDGSGNGRWITILVSPYTDSGYSSPSTIDAAKHDTWLIQRRVNAVRMGGGVGLTVDYKEIRKIVVEELKGLPDKKEPDIYKMVNDSVNRIPKLDTFPITEAIDNLKRDIPLAIQEQESKEHELTRADAKAILSALKEVRNYLDQAKLEDSQQHENTRQAVQGASDKTSNDLQELQALNRLEQAIQHIQEFFGKYMDRKDQTDERLDEILKYLDKMGFFVLKKGLDNPDATSQGSELGN